MTEPSLTKYHNNEKLLTKTREALDDYNKKQRDKINEIRTEFRDKKWKLEAQEREQTQTIEKRKEEHEQTINKTIEALSQVINRVGRVLEFIDVSRRDQDLTLKVYRFVERRNKKGGYVWRNGSTIKDEVCFKPIGTLARDEFKQVFAYIVPNGKPTNKFSLIVLGKSLFAGSEKLGLNTLSYGCCISGVHDNRASIEKDLKSLPTEEALLTWYEKNKDKILKDYLAKHENTEKEYVEALEYSKKKEWQVLYWEKEKGYWGACCSGDERPEYKRAVKELAKLGVRA